MKINIVTLSLIFVFLNSCNLFNKNEGGATENSLTRAEYEAIVGNLMATQDAWNDGDLEGFMKGYWESDKLVFTGVDGPTYGYLPTLKHYKENYPDRETMGLLKFTLKDLYKIDSITALMIGKFYLSRNSGDLVGYFTLVWQEIDGEWLIISDHSSGYTLSRDTI